MALAFVLCIGTSGAAAAHAPPHATGIRWLGERALVRTNRGFILQDESESSFRLLCNDATQAALAEIPPVEVTSDGRLLTATYAAGLVLSSADHCSFSAVTATLEDTIVRDLTVDSTGRFHAAVIPRDGSASALLHSQDDGRRFDGQTLLAGIPTSVLVAPSDPMRVYVAASVGDGDALSAKLQSSSDGGQSFEEAPIELLTSELRAYVLAIDPRDSNRVFVRTESRDALLPERILFNDGIDGAFETVLETFGPISMGYDTDGVAWAGAAGGLYRFDDLERTFVAATSFDLSYVTCVAAHAGRLYVCGFHENEFGVLVSSDRGASFEWFLRFPQVTARLDCPPTSDEGMSCEAAFLDWSQEQGLGTPMPAAGSGGEASSFAGSSGQAGGGAPASSSGGSNASRPAAGRGCGVAPAPALTAHGLLSVLVASSVFFTRRRLRSYGARCHRAGHAAC